MSQTPTQTQPVISSSAGTPRGSTAGSTKTSLSPSRASDFTTCPLLYRFRVIDRLPQRPSPEAVRGTLVHRVLERLFDLPAVRRTVDEAAALVAPAWEQLREAEPEVGELFGADALDEGAWLASAHGLLERWFTLEDPTRLEPSARELYVETELETGLLLRGYVDRLDVAPDGAMRVVDYKTGKAPTPGFEAKAMFQMRFYALVLWRLHGRVPRMLQLVYLGSGEILRYQPDEADLRATQRKLEAVWAAISRAAETGDWRPSPSRLCDWCDFRDLCPAWGGTPPPLPTGPVELAPDAADELPSVTAPIDEV